MTQETKLAELVGQAHFLRAQARARTYAARFACPVFIYRTKAGFTMDTTAPVMGERWRIDPTGQCTHVAGPVI